MAVYTWSHTGPLLTEVYAAGSGASGPGAASTPDFVTAMNTWIGTGDENGGTGTLNFTSDGGNQFFASFAMQVQIEDPGTIDPLATVVETTISFDYTIVNGPMASGDAQSAINSSWDASDDLQAEGTTVSTYSRSTDGATFGTPTFGDFFTFFASGTGIVGMGFAWTLFTDSGTFSAHDRSILVSNLVITASDGASPVVTDVSPTHGDAAGGDVVILTGTDFTGATTVLFGDTAAPSVTVDSDTQITCLAPSHAVGDVTVTVS